ncbi:hypothetical protein RND71_022687 [Anisodus tanguticus]|uniref:Uncharacterized protein n=1 Tax=Anisodus tanguticus TaxID=243964 RepID=A0AAE1RU66_9SOLA|nr:hypothetical protein RND71_022687 [Anisodus tanguticus]
MKKATFLKVFLVSFLLILLGQGSNVVSGCSTDADCVTVVRCIDATPICDETHKCRCPTANFNGPKGVQKTGQN